MAQPAAVQNKIEDGRMKDMLSNMKKNIFIAVMVFCLVNAYAQDNVGIGTNNPKSKLDINGGLTVGTGYAGVSAAPANSAIIEGKIGIGTTLPGAKLDIAGGAD